jgi:CubicO group peptidase (beta-lactamase class C family)
LQRRLYDASRKNASDEINLSTVGLTHFVNCHSTGPVCQTMAAFHPITQPFGAARSHGIVGQLLDRVGADRLDFEPGHGWRYSNVGYFFIRRKIEETTGHDIGSALRHLVFDALSLKSVHVVTTAGDLANTAWGN